MITFGSLFAGIGGFDLGLERAGMVCKWQVEIDGYANRVLEKHWPSVERYRDIQTFPEKCQSPWLGGSWRDKYAVDVICGGFPCQDISYAGRGAGLDGERSGLFFEAIRVVRELQPRAVVLENVAALLTRGLDRVLGTLAEIGYDAEWHCIPAAAVGAPHIRDRVFVIGTHTNATEYGRQQRNEDGGRRREGTREREECRSRSVREDVADADSKRLSKRNESGNNPKEAGSIFSRCELERTLAENGRKQWSIEPDVGRVANGISKRVDRLRGLGNAIVPQVSEYVGRMILGKFDNSKR
jgi:DNA (cytosine-5)-methyltransferase 1